MTRPLAFAMAGVWSAGIVGLFGTSAATDSPELRLAAVALYGVPSVIAALVALTLRPSRVDRPILMLLAAYAAVCLSSVDRTASLETLGLVLLYASWFVVIQRLGDGPIREGLTVGAGAAIVTWLLVLAVQWTSSLMVLWSLTGAVPPLTSRWEGPWLSTDAAAAAALLALPLIAAIRARPIRTALMAMLGLSSVVVIPLSGGRSAMLAMGVALITFIVVQRTANIRLAVRVRAGLAVTVALIGAAMMAGALGSLSGRVPIWSTTVALIQAHPLVGTGPGTFSWMRLTEALEGEYVYPVYHTHNMVLQTLADGGVLLLAALLIFLITYVRSRDLVRLGSLDRLRLSALVGFAALLMMDELTQIPAFAVIGLTHAASIRLAPLHRAPDQRTGWTWSLPAAFTLLMVLAIPSSLAAHQARTAAAHGRELVVAGSWQEARSQFTTAVRAWPSRAPYELSLGLIASELGEMEAAKVHYDRARELSPGDPRPIGALAALDTHQAEEARLLTEAMSINVGDPQYAYRLGLVLLEMGRKHEATAVLGAAALWDRQLLSAMSGTTVDVGAVIAQVTRLAHDETRRPTDGLEFLLSEVRLVEGWLDTGTLELNAVAAARANDSADAQSIVAAALEASPYAPASLKVALAIAEHACDEATLHRLRDIMARLPRGHSSLYSFSLPARESVDHVYREPGIGDYQPPWALHLPTHPAFWPRGYLGPSACGSDG